MIDVVDLSAQARRASPQRWALAFAAVVAATLMPIVTGVAGPGQSPIVLVIVVALATSAVIQPDSHIALLVPFVALWHWTVSTDASVSGWAFVAGICLLTFHTLVALMSTTPARATIDQRSLVRWLRRSALVAAATGATWMLVVAVDQLDLAGNALVTAVGFVAATTLMVALIAPRRTPAGVASGNDTKRSPTSRPDDR